MLVTLIFGEACRQSVDKLYLSGLFHTLHSLDELFIVSSMSVLF